MDSYLRDLLASLHLSSLLLLPNNIVRPWKLNFEYSLCQETHRSWDMVSCIIKHIISFALFGTLQIWIISSAAVIDN